MNTTEETSLRQYRVQGYGELNGKHARQFEYVLKAKNPKQAREMVRERCGRKVSGGIIVTDVEKAKQQVLDAAQRYANNRNKELVVIVDYLRRYTYHLRYNRGHEQNGVDHGIFGMGTLVTFITPKRGGE